MAYDFCVTMRMTLSLDDATGSYIKQCAAAMTRGNASAFVERLVRQQAVRDSVASYVAWQRDHPSYALCALQEAEAADAEMRAA